MKMDALNTAIAEVLQQKNKLIEFYLKWLNSVEQNYIITEKEMLVIIHEVKI